MALIAAHLNAGVILVDSVAIGILSPSSPTSIPPPFSPLLWFLWTLSTMFTYLLLTIERNGEMLISAERGGGGGGTSEMYEICKLCRTS